MKLLPRRTFLRGAVAGTAVSLALPLLEAMLSDKGAYADGSQDGPFFGLFFWANGLPWHAGHGTEQAVGQDLWTPSTTGAGYSATPLLTPLARHNVSVATGLEPKTEIPPSPAGQGDGHMRGFMVAMTGDRPRSMGFNHPSHTLTARRPTLDQYVARHDQFYQEAPRFRSLVVGVSEARFHDYGHWNAISYNGPDALNLPISRATVLFDQLFDVPADAVQLNRRARVLDAVLEDAQSLRNRLGARDQQRLDDHLAHISEIQHRLERSAGVCEEPPRPNNSGDLIQKTEMMAELLALAMECNLSRVFSFMLTAPASTHSFTNLGVRDGMHKTCHDGHWNRVRDITQYHMEAFAAFLDKFAERPQMTGGTLLDRACIFGTSEYGEGWKHGTRELPAVLAGTACGRLNAGVHFREERGNLSRAHVTVLRSLGIDTPSYGFNGGETTQGLDGILV
ncbi:MAG: DUF1552 domain-containing protein [Myxococcota bacterium]